MLYVDNITKVLPNGKQLLKGISFDIKEGEFVGIIGPSGAGKTLTMRTLNGLMQPSSGSVNVKLDKKNKINIASVTKKELRVIRQKIGIIFQGFNLVKQLTVLDNVLIGKLGQINKFRSLTYGFNDSETEEAIEALKLVKIDHLAHRKTEGLSGGEMQRVAIARAMFQNPLFLLADEPIANLDPSNAKSIMKLLSKLSLKTPIVGVFHQPEMVTNYCSRLIAIKDGKIFYDGKPNISDKFLYQLYEGEFTEIVDNKNIPTPDGVRIQAF
jgi:phosphonate transport system ATP-binding protein